MGRASLRLVFDGLGAMSSSRRTFREQHEGRPLELPDAPSSMDLLECARLGITYPELQRRRGVQRAATRAETRQAMKSAGKGRAFSLGELPGIDAPIMRAGVALSLPWSTLHSINGMFTIVGKEYQGAKARAREKLAAQLEERKPLECRVAVDVVLVCPDRRPRDLDNYEKLIYDSLKGLAYRDDSLIDDKRIRRAIDVDRPRADITVTPL
jgi:Holliday junction resolvase RusA-like endonuclease